MHRHRMEWNKDGEPIFIPDENGDWIVSEPHFCRIRSCIERMELKSFREKYPEESWKEK